MTEAEINEKAREIYTRCFDDEYKYTGVLNAIVIAVRETAQEMAEKKIVYLSGKITGRSKADYTRQFALAERFYKMGGFDVVNPVKIGEEILKKNPHATHADFMEADLKALAGCTHIALLKGWESSKGANMEKAEAEKLGLKVLYLLCGGRK